MLHLSWLFPILLLRHNVSNATRALFSFGDFFSFIGIPYKVSKCRGTVLSFIIIFSTIPKLTKRSILYRHPNSIDYSIQIWTTYELDFAHTFYQCSSGFLCRQILTDVLIFVHDRATFIIISFISLQHCYLVFIRQLRGHVERQSGSPKNYTLWFSTTLLPWLLPAIYAFLLLSLPTTAVK